MGESRCIQDLIMSQKYIPPHRRRQAGDETSVEDSPATSTPAETDLSRLHQGTEHGSQDEDVSRSEKLPGPYHRDDIKKYFMGWEYPPTTYSYYSPFNSSKDLPEDLSYILIVHPEVRLFNRYHLAFGRRALHLLPEYEENKTAAITNGWPTCTDEGESETSDLFSHLLNSPPGDGPCDSDNEYHADQEVGGDGDHLPTLTSTTEVHASTSSTPASGGGANKSAVVVNEKDEKREDQPGEGTPEQPTPPSTQTTRQKKYKGSREETIYLTSASDEPPTGEFEHGLNATPPIDYEPTACLPIAVFEEREFPGFRKCDGSYFAFTGWFKIVRVNVLAPNSAAICRMLRLKHGGNDLPDVTAINLPRLSDLLKSEWAVVRLELLDAPAPPQIKKQSAPSEKGIRGEKKWQGGLFSR